MNAKEEKNYLPPLAEIVKSAPEQIICTSTDGNLQDFTVFDEVWP